MDNICETEKKFLMDCPYCDKEIVLEYEDIKNKILCTKCNNIIELDWEETRECNNKDCGKKCCSSCSKKECK